MNSELSKEKDELPILKKETLNIFNPSNYLKEKISSFNTNLIKNNENEYNKSKILLKEYESKNNLKVEDEEMNFYDNKITKIIDEIKKNRILIKLKKNVMSLVDGRIIWFSDLIKILCSYNSFNYRLTLEELDRDSLDKILDFMDIIEWDKSRYIWENKYEELNKWFDNIENLEQFEFAITYLKINHIIEYLKFKKESKNKKKAGNLFVNLDFIFQTQINVNQITQKDLKEMGDSTVNLVTDTKKTKNFQEAFPPNFNPEKLSLELPVEIYTIRLNATKNFPHRGKLNLVFKDKLLSEYVDAIISDSFWFVVAFFRSKNELDKKICEDLKKTAAEILKRISCNYFKFFINLCDDDSPVKKKDPILNIFHDFLSQCVFYSLFLGFPKSRHIFNDKFRHKIISLFAYLCNGLGAHSTFNVDHWDLDLGTGNIIESSNQTSRKISKILFYLNYRR